MNGGDRLAEAIALQLHLSGDHRLSPLGWILNACQRDEDTALDVLDAVLHWTGGNLATANSLNVNLELGGSVWKVNDQRTGLERRVAPEEQDCYERAASAGDEAAAQLREAWANVYGRNPDPSDAWDHAIKACEALLCEIVAPKDQSNTLGKVIAAIRSAPGKFTLRLSGNPRGVDPMDTFRGQLELIWASQPDRHASGPSRPPTLEEATDVVHLAVVVANLVRRGAFGLAPTT